MHPPQMAEKKQELANNLTELRRDLYVVTIVPKVVGTSFHTGCLLSFMTTKQIRSFPLHIQTKNCSDDVS